MNTINGFQENNDFSINESEVVFYNLSKIKLKINQKLDEIKNSYNLRCFWPKCEYKTNHLSHLKAHHLIHNNIKHFKCDFNNCNEEFKKAQELISHKRQHSGEKAFVCNYNNCGKKFRHSSSLIEHKNRYHLNIRRYKCIYNNCKKNFISKRGLKPKICCLNTKSCFEIKFVPKYQTWLYSRGVMLYNKILYYGNYM